MAKFKYIPFLSKKSIDSLVKELNDSDWFRKEFYCIDCAVAVWYHFFKEPIFHSKEKIRGAQENIDKIIRHLLFAQIFEDEVTRENMYTLCNLTTITQASNNRAMPLHVVTLLVDEHEERYILEKDGCPAPVALIPLSEWKTYEKKYPVYAAYGPSRL